MRNTPVCTTYRLRGMLIIWEVFCSVWGHFYTDAEPAAEHGASNLEAPLNSTHSLLSDQIVMYESL
jgi:hypothetical protein